MATNIEASGNTLKISYLRFISDAAPGLVLILAAIVMHSNGMPVVGLVGTGQELKTLAAVVALLLAVPFGLVVNGLSYVLLGGIQTWVDQLCFRARGWPLDDSHRSLLTADWSRCFEVQGGEQWPVVAEVVDELLLIYDARLAEALDHVRALKKFLRSMAFLALAGLVFRVITELGGPGAPCVCDPVAWVLFVCALGTMWLAGFITFYHHASAMMRAYILCGFPPQPKTISLSDFRSLLIKRAGAPVVQRDEELVEE